MIAVRIAVRLGVALWVAQGSGTIFAGSLSPRVFIIAPFCRVRLALSARHFLFRALDIIVRIRVARATRF